MQKYELLLVLPGTLDEKEADKKSQELLGLIKEYGTEVELQTLGKNRLAYPVKLIRYGYFYTIIFQAEAEKVVALQAKFTLMRDLLRFMISHYNMTLSEIQKAAYSENPVVRENVPAAMEKMMVEAEQPKAAAAPVATPARKEEPKASMEDIKKKLDQIIDETDIIPGV